MSESRSTNSKKHLLIRDLGDDIKGFLNTLVRDLDALLDFSVVRIPVETQNVKRIFRSDRY